MKREKSSALFEKAKKYFPGGVNSPVRAFRSVGGTPLFIERGKGARIWDADDNEFIDYCGSWGPLILGHANTKVVDAIKKTVEKGSSFGAPTALENELAELILNNNKYIEKIRFVSSGTEAVMSAIRLARGYTKRNKILKFEGCYHGHSDSLLVKAGSGLVTFGNTSSDGVPESFVNETIVVSLNNEQAVEQAFQEFKDQIACIIIEPIPANNGLLLQRKEYLQFLRDICTKNKALLIFDEVISGFRVGFSGAAGYYDIRPDIITYGKIIGGGLPVGMYGASAEIMSRISPEGGVYQAGTLSGNPVAMAAGIAQLTECLKPNFYKNLETKTKFLIAQIEENVELGTLNFKLFSIGSIFWLAFTNKEQVRSAEEIDADSMKYFKILHKELLERGIYLGPSGYEVGFVNEAHTQEDLLSTAKMFGEAFAIALKEA
ncbi:Glutamate-1-semialdehyde 2,1-aminomutase [sediment metagenome]|uniref:glutamate-1-semialdehyde 2,1-aminomutase n=1 Tax=sediment metagenome TaxID=749907 RepID=D9PHT2_9ZZZZ